MRILLPWLEGAAGGRLPDREICWHEGAACCVVMVSGGYPGTIQSGSPINGVPVPVENEMVFFAGARRDGSEVVNSGGPSVGRDCTRFGFRRGQSTSVSTCAWNLNLQRLIGERISAFQVKGMRRKGDE